MKKSLFIGIFAVVSLGMSAQSLTPEVLSRIQAKQTPTVADKAIHNALAAGDVSALATNHANQGEMDTYFNYSVQSKGITDQKGSGRCWMFTGLNVLRAQMMRRHKLQQPMEFSEVYLFFYDQLEKANLFLQAVIDTRSKGMDDKTVEWLFKNPLSDGGTFTGVADLTQKYGVVPASVMPETYASNNTSRFTSLVKRKLREDGIRLRKAGKGADLQGMKEEMLAEIYHMLALGFGEPVKAFKWAPKDKEGKFVSEPKTYTPQEFYAEFLGNDLQNDYIMLMNDPTREYWRTYEIEYDRHTYDGHNWRYLNLPLEDIKEMAIANIGSISGMEGDGYGMDYPTAKSGAMFGLTKSLARFGAPYGIRAVCISPGPVLTRPAWANMKTLLGRAAEPREIVDLILFIASDQGQFINGENILIDGGRNAMGRA